MRGQMRREFRNHRAQGAERLREIQMAVDRGEFDDAGFDLDSLNARIEHSFDGRHGTLDFQVLRFFSDDRKARGLEQLLGLGNKRGAWTKLLVELWGGH